MTFKITDYVSPDAKGRAQCPACLNDGKTAKNLSISLTGPTEGAYKCFRGHTPEEIRSALGASRPALLPPQPPEIKRYTPPPQTFSPQECEKYHEALRSDGAVAIAARQWLTARGITIEIQQRHKLGLRRKRIKGAMVYALVIPICVDAANGRYILKERIQPWAPVPDAPPWIYQGGGALLWNTYAHPTAKEIWLCAGEWDAMMLGNLARFAGAEIQVWTNTTGEGAIPDLHPIQGSDLPVRIFYDLDAAGAKGGAKVAEAIGKRATCYRCPAPDDDPPDGWDVSDALNAGLTLDHFVGATKIDPPPPPETPHHKKKSLRDRLTTNDELIATAPETIEYLVPELLPANELFVVAAAPRGGKSLLMMGLAHAVATGGSFLNRPCCQGSVIYVNLEDGAAKIRERQEFQRWGKGLPIWWIDDFKLNEIEELIAVCAEIKPSLIILDTLSRVKSTGDEGGDMTPVLEPLQLFAKRQSCSVVVVHHTKKLSAEALESTDPFDLIRGHSSIRATARGAWLLAKGENTDRLIVEHGNGKHDLAITLNLATLSWIATGQWKPLADQSMSDRILAYLSTKTEATNPEIAAAIKVKQRSLATVLWRLQSDGLITKRSGGGPNPSIYSKVGLIPMVGVDPPASRRMEDPSWEAHPPTESVNSVVSVDASVDAFSSGTARDTALCQQKNNFFPTENQISGSVADLIPRFSTDPPLLGVGVDASTETPQTLAGAEEKASTKRQQGGHYVDAVEAFSTDQISDQVDQLAIISDQLDHFSPATKMVDPAWDETDDLGFQAGDLIEPPITVLAAYPALVPPFRLESLTPQGRWRMTDAQGRQVERTARGEQLTRWQAI